MLPSDITIRMPTTESSIMAILDRNSLSTPSIVAIMEAARGMIDVMMATLRGLVYCSAAKKR